MAEYRSDRAEASTDGASEGTSLDVHAYWRTLVRRRWLVIPFFSALVLLTVVVTLRQTKIYDAVCTLIIDVQAPRVLEKEQVQDIVETGTGGYWYSREYYETQYKVILSRAVAERVATRLRLASDPRYQGTDIVRSLQENLRVEPVKESRIARIRFEDPDPAFAAQVANAFADAYIAENLEVRSATTASAADWLEGQLADLEKKLDESGKALFDFKRAHDIVSTTWEDRQSMVSQRITAANDALSRTRVRKAELQARNDALTALGPAIEQGGPEVEALPQFAASQTLQAIKFRYLETQADCADLKVKYLGEHPKTMACERKLEVTRQAMTAELKTAVEAVRKEYAEVQQIERNLQGLLNEVKSDAFSLNQYERNYLELKRTYDNNTRLYELVLKRLKDTGVTSMLQMSNVRVLDRALPSSTPVRPSLLRNLFFAIIVGMFGGLGLAFAAEYADRTITGQQQIEENLGVAFLGVIPSIERNRDGTAQDLFVHTAPKSAASECLRAVRTNLLFMSPDKPLKTIMVTSAGPQEGKTTTATSLAITMVGSGNRVLLVDADMRRPRVHRIFGVPNGQGLSSLILGDGQLETTVKATAVEGLDILPCGPIPPNPAELLHTAGFQRVLQEAAQRYDRVIIDSPPIGVVADAVVMGTQVDGTLLVLKAGKTDRDAARQSVKQLKDVQAAIFGAVLNDLDLNDQRYGKYSYYYQYGYYYGHGSDKQATASNKG